MKFRIVTKFWEEISMGHSMPSGLMAPSDFDETY